MKLFVLLVLLVLSHSGWAENEKQISQLERALMRVQQDAQATHQQFLMIQELRRNEVLGSPLAGIPGATTQSTPIPKYENIES